MRRAAAKSGALRPYCKLALELNSSRIAVFSRGLAQAGPKSAAESSLHGLVANRLRLAALRASRVIPLRNPSGVNFW